MPFAGLAEVMLSRSVMIGLTWRPARSHKTGTAFLLSATLGYIGTTCALVPSAQGNSPAAARMGTGCMGDRGTQTGSARNSLIIERWASRQSCIDLSTEERVKEEK